MAFCKRFVRSEVGAVKVVEATFVYPIVFFIMGILIFMSCLLLQKSALQSDAERVALAVSKVKAQTGYNLFGNVISSAADFPMEVSDSLLRNVLEESEPYRYLQSDVVDLATLNDELESLISRNRFLIPSQIDCQISCERKILNQQIVVHVTNRVNLPSFVRYLGLEKLLLIDITATATVSDPAEFIKNVDIAFDVGGFLNEKYQLQNKLTTFVDRIKKMLVEVK